MKIGVPKEIKNNENRVSMTPANVATYISNGHEVFVETNAGLGSGFEDADYSAAGAKIVSTAKEAWSQDMVVKVKEPLQSEYQYFREDLILYTYLHLAAEKELTDALLENKVTGFAYETVVDGGLPLLRPMSEVAGRRSVTIGATYLEKHHGGSGVLIGGTPGVEPATVTVVGGGVAGVNATQMAVGLGAKVNIIELNEHRIRHLTEIFDTNVTVVKSSEQNIAKCVKESDLVISTILLPGAKAPKIIKEYMVKSMRKGSVIVDISIDQGGSVETIDRITTHDNPVFEKHGILHSSVANMPGATPRTSTIALTNATTDYGVKLANAGVDIIKTNMPLRTGVNTFKGKITFKGVADAFGMEHTDVMELI